MSKYDKKCDNCSSTMHYNFDEEQFECKACGRIVSADGKIINKGD